MVASIKILGKEYTAEGKTPYEAISQLRIEGFTKVKSMLSVGDKTIILMPVQTLRLFANQPMVREMALKSTASRF